MTVTVGRLLVARVSGIHRCGSIWACALCAPVVRQGRAREIDLAAGRVLAAGGSALLVTYTGPHRKGEPLRPLFDATARFGELVFRGAKAQKLKQELGWLGLIRALEVTYGRPPFDHGWHPHGHALLLFDRKLSPDQIARLRTFIFLRWEGALMKRGFPRLHPVRGVDARPVVDTAGLAEYVTTVEDGWGVGLELARADLKHRGLTPMELLGNWALGGDLEARALWQEYELATFNRNCIQWTPGLRARLLPEQFERTDEQLAIAEGEDEVLVMIQVGAQQWNLWVRAGQVGRCLAEMEQVAALFMLLAGQLGGASRKEQVRVR